MTVQSSLILDHLFFSTDEAAFTELRDLFLRFECTSHQNVVADGDAWEGLYIKTRGDFYLEVLKGRRPNCTGLCQKTIRPLYFDTRDVADELPELPWKSFDRHIDGQPWFTALSCDNYLDLTTPFNTWVMHYFPLVAKRPFEFKKHEIQKIYDFELEADPLLKERVKMNSSWFNGEKHYSPDLYTFTMPTYFSDPVQVKVQFKKGVRGTQLRKLKFKFVPEFAPQDLSVAMKYFSLSSASDHYVLERLGV